MQTCKHVTFNYKAYKETDLWTIRSLLWQHNNLLKGIYFYWNSFWMKKISLVIWVTQIQLHGNGLTGNDRDPATATYLTTARLSYLKKVLNIGNLFHTKILSSHSNTFFNLILLLWVAVTDLFSGKLILTMKIAFSITFSGKK